MLKCMKCGNTEVFITERLALHWATVNGDGELTSLAYLQVDAAAPSYSEEPIEDAYIECGECYSTNVEEIE